jgi:hypothetical protein
MANYACVELGVCQHRLAPCSDCPEAWTKVRGDLVGGHLVVPLQLAPGVVDGPYTAQSTWWQRLTGWLRSVGSAPC